MIDLSIIIPVYNVSVYIEACLESILRQDSRDNIEIILIDDGSTDDSGKKCDQYAQQHDCIKLVHKVNEGVSIARNTGIEMAKGEWISFVDPDDYVSDDYLSFFHSIKESDYDLVFFSFCYLYKSGEITNKEMESHQYFGRQSVQEGMFDLMRNKSNFEFLGYTVNKFFRSRIIHQHQVRFTAKQSFREDELFTLEYCRHINSLSTNTSVLYIYRDLSDSLSHKKTKMDEVVIYTDTLLKLIGSYDDIRFKSMEYDRALHVLINAYSPELSKEQKVKLQNHLAQIVQTYPEYLNHLRKTNFYRAIFSMPHILSFPIMDRVLLKVYYQNLRSAA